ncbi:phage tail protein [Paenibacillus lentus]|uniref:Phage tail protein n=1 Tax=Paenibacillus lentus TaxID=1338368 RepID=A0A3Q8SE97_9BACL|nr:phage tail protein [Paenibacillus lentus]AZK48783.1 hypothetical protein EIM92_23525 [Paenibacillus lentus]
MATFTKNYNLIKPGEDEFYDIGVNNNNADIIDEKLKELEDGLSKVEVPLATTTEPGITQLSSATDSNREDRAATSKAVKVAYDAATAAQTTANAANMAAEAAKTLGNERKAEVVAALVAKGISASTSESWDSLITKMAGIIKATGNATAADVLSGKTFSNAGGNSLTGTMINRSAESHHQLATDTAREPGIRVFFQPPAGYYNGSSWVYAASPQLAAENLPKDVNIFGIQGILERLTTAEKEALAYAITTKSIVASVDDSNTVLAQKIHQIPMKRTAQGEGVTDSNGYIRVRGLDFSPETFFYRYKRWSSYFGIAHRGNISTNLINENGYYKSFGGHWYVDGLRIDTNTGKADESFAWYAIE